MKRVIKLNLIILLTFTFLTGCEVSKEESKSVEEQVKTNTTEEITKNQTLEVFEFTNTSLVYENGTSILETTVTNTSDKTEYLTEFKIHVRDTDKKEIVELTGFIGDSIKAGESKIITSSYGDDLTTAASIDYEIVR